MYIHIYASICIYIHICISIIISWCVKNSFTSFYYFSLFYPHQSFKKKLVGILLKLHSFMTSVKPFVDICEILCNLLCFKNIPLFLAWISLTTYSKHCFLFVSYMHNIWNDHKIWIEKRTKLTHLYFCLE